MSNLEAPTAADPADDPASARRRKRAAVYLFAFYGVATPLFTALAVWVFYLLTKFPGGFLNLERHLGFWLVVAFAGGSPVLLAAALAHFLARRRTTLATGAIVLCTGAVGWILMGAMLDPRQIAYAVLPGLLVLVLAFPLAQQIYRRTVLPGPQESAKAGR